MPPPLPSIMCPQEPLSACQGIDELGFLPGWGNTVGRVRESFQMLLDILQVGRGCWAGVGLDVLCLKWRETCFEGDLRMPREMACCCCALSFRQGVGWREGWDLRQREG